MSVITAKSLREKTSQELQDQLLLTKKQLFDGVVKSASGESIKPHEKREGKRLIARIQAILRERVLRKTLDKEIADLTPKAKDATPAIARLVKRIDERGAEIKAELAKDEAKRKVKPIFPRVRPKHVEITSVADRAAVYLAEVKRRRLSIERDDVGQGK